jgi:hypothetical protein
MVQIIPIIKQKVQAHAVLSKGRNIYNMQGFIKWIADGL